MNAPDPLSPRHRLPERRLTETRRVAHIRPDGSTTRILVSVGYAADDPMRPMEVFYSEGFKSGSDMEFTVQDACVLISLLLQHGISPARIASSMSTRNDPDDLATGEPVAAPVGDPVFGSLAGTIAAELAHPPAWASADQGEQDE